MNASVTHPSSLVTQLESEVVRRHTDAPLRLRGSFVFYTDAETLFHRVSDPEAIASWFGMIRAGSTDHGGSCNVGAWGEGTKRYCKTKGMGTLDETILHWDPPTAYLYNVKNPMMPIDHHAALMVVETAGPKRCRFTWHQYFVLTGLVMRHVFPSMMRSMMDDGMAKLRAELGGEPGEMQLVAL